MSDFVKKHSAEFGIVFQGLAVSFMILPTVGKKAVKPGLLLVPFMLPRWSLPLLGRDRKFLQAWRQGKQIRGRWIPYEEWGQKYDVGMYGRWGCRFSESGSDGQRIRIVVETSSNEAQRLREGTEKMRDLELWLGVWCVGEGLRAGEVEVGYWALVMCWASVEINSGVEQG